jgi:hypothetical protein
MAEVGQDEEHLACCIQMWSMEPSAGACFSPDRDKRFCLWRVWDHTKPLMAVIMLNPSIADEQHLDPTLRRVFNYANDWGFGGMVIMNAFAWVATDRHALLNPPISLRLQQLDVENDAHIITTISSQYVSRVMVGWGGELNRKALEFRKVMLDAMIARFSPDKTMAWRISGGQPGHPLYLRADIEPVPYKPTVIVVTGEETSNG